MTFSFLNRCIFTAAGGGTSDFTVGAAALGGYTPAQCANPSVVSSGSYHYFAINGTTEHEEGDGVYSAGVLTRAAVRNSSNSGAKINFSAAPTVFMGGPLADDVDHIFDVLTPNITSASSFSANVGDTGTLYTGTATTPIGRQVFTWSLSGTDAADFDINSNAGVITFDNPSGVSVGSKAITLQVSDGVLTDQLAITATVSAGDADALAWKAAVIGAGGTVSAGRFTLVNNLVTGLKSDGVWTKLDRLWLFAAENTQSALIDLVANVSATPHSSPTFTTDRGYAGNGSTSYIDTGFAPNAGTTFLRNSAHFSLWTLTKGTPPAGSEQRHGAIDGGAANGVYISAAGNGLDRQLSNINTAFDTTIASFETAPGFVIGNRSGANATQLYWNGSSVVTGTDASSAPISDTLYLGGRHFGASLNQPSDEQFAFCSIGGSLSGADAGNLHSRLGTYKTAVGA